MNGKKAFFYSFLISMAVVTAGFGGLFILSENLTRETDTPQHNVPKAVAGVEDSKTLLLCVDSDFPYFFIFKFNAIENRVGVVAISPSYRLKNGRSLGQVFASTGAMQCLMDIKDEFGIGVDYYLQCSWQQLGKMCAQLADISLDSLGRVVPDSVKNYLLKGAEMLDCQSLVNRAEKAGAFMDNRLGLEFMARRRTKLVECNMDRLARGPGQAIKDEYSRIVTNINTEGLKRLDRITAFLAGHARYSSAVILQGDSRRQEKMDSVIQ